MNLTGKLYLIRRIFAVVGRSGAIRFIVRRAMGDTKSMAVRVNGYRHPVYVRPAKSDMWMLLQVLAGKEYRFAEKKALSTILDLGGNCGYASIFFATCFPDARIICVEPDSENFEILKRNLAGYPNVIPVNAAVWDTDGWVCLANPSAEASELSYAEPIGNESDKVRSISVSTIAKEHGISAWSLIKMDIEGAELRMLRCGEDWIPSTSTIAMEIHDECRGESERLLNSFTAGWPVRFEAGETYWRSRSELA